MKKVFYYITFLLVFFYSCTDSIDELVESSVSDATTRSFLNEKEVFYWFKGEKMPLKEIDNRSYIIFKKTDKESVISYFSILDEELDISDVKKLIRNDNLLKDDVVEAYKDLLWADIKVSVETAYSNPDILYAAPYYRNPSDNSEFPLTNMLYVFLKDKGDLSALEKITKEYRIEIIRELPDFPLVYMLACDKESAGNALEVANSLYETGIFEAVEPIFLSMTLDAPNDQYFSNQWNLKHTSQYGYSGYDIKYMQASNANLIPSTGNVIVGVVDSGIELTHTDISLASFNWNVFTSNSNSTTYLTHGTKVAGIITGITNNSIGIAGITSNVGKAMSITAIDSNNVIEWEDASVAIKKAVDQGASVINCSWSGGSSNYLVEQAIYYALTYGRNGKGCIITCAAGNKNGSSLRYPASHTPEMEVIAVGGISYNGKRKNYSTPDGETTWGSNYGTNLDIVAPCVKIPTTTTGNSWVTSFSGTSASTPHVSGVAALMLAWNPNLSYDEVGQILKITANKSLPGYSFTNSTYGTWNNEVGYGLLNMYAALNMAKSTSYNSYGNVSLTGGQTNLNSGGSGYVGTSFTTSYNSGYKYYWSGSYTGTCDRWYVTPNGNNSNVGNVSVYLNPGQSGTLAVTCRVYSNTAYIGKATQYVYVSY